MSSYNTSRIPNVRTIKAIRGESLTIDLGKTFEGTLQAWMKKDPNADTYRSFTIIDNRYLQLPQDKTRDYYNSGGQLVEEIKGKWYWDVEQVLDPAKPEEVKTIYKGTISFANDITGSSGVEVQDPEFNLNTFIGLTDTPASYGQPGQIAVVNQGQNALIWVDVPESIVTEDITASVQVGGIEIGDDVSQGTNLTEVVRQLIAPTVLAIVKTNKSVVAAGIAAQTLEIGTPFNDQLTYTFNQGLIESKDGSPDVDLVGPENNVAYTGTGIDASGAISTPIVAGSQTWGVQVSHDAGVDPYYDSDGNPGSNLDALRVAATIADNANSITGRYQYWYAVGAEGSTPDLSAAIRALLDVGFANNLTFDITIPAGDKEVAIYLPDTMTLTQVLYVESANADVTGTFAPEVVSVDDGGGTPVGYTKHEAIIGGVGYPVDATYRVTINL